MSKHSGPEKHVSAGDLSCPVAQGVYNEMAEAPGQPRRHWRGLMASLQQLGRQELQSRSDNARRIIREHGVTYNVYGDPQGIDRPWGLDLVPLLLSADEWARIEAGLIQRTRLFNLILADIYGGSQRLLRDGFIPPELVYANPGFLRPCRGIRVTGQVYLHAHACDLGRSPDGQWWVLSDRTQAPSGAGYALENRAVISRILPDQIRTMQIERLARFFQQQRDNLVNFAPARDKNPAVVLLTPGPHNETYFEHAYLARHLGFPLVEGADLTVRQRRVFLKTIEGLQPVDVILRRLDDAFCDPLELRGDSLLGVSGLVEATRAGTVTIANALGSGLMESPAFLAFLPGLCRHLLGQELLLPSIGTWWCGQANELRYVLQHLDSLIIKPAFASQTSLPLEGAYVPANRRKAAERRQALTSMIHAAPNDFVAQERLRLSRAPAWVDDHFDANAVILRGYAANGGSSVSVLPGGLTRILRNPNSLVASMQAGSGSKDTWVLSNGAEVRPETQPSSDAATHEISEATQKFDALEHADPAVAEDGRAPSTDAAPSGVPSRAAEHLFWLGRYTERLEQLIRVLRCVLGRISSESSGEYSSERTALIELAANLGLGPFSKSGANPAPTPRSERVSAPPKQSGFVRELSPSPLPCSPGENERTHRHHALSERLLQLLRDPNAPGGARELLNRVRLIASAVRDRFSGDTWRILGRLDADGHRRPGRLPLASAIELCHDLVLDLAAFNGMEMENMTRGRGWRFLDFGRRLERGLGVVKVLQAALNVKSDSDAVLEPVLEISDSVMTYRRQYFAAPHRAGVFTLLFREDSNPRSLAFQIHQLAAHISDLVENGDVSRPAIERNRVDTMLTALSSEDFHTLVSGGNIQPVSSRLSACANELTALSDDISNRYFSHSIPRIS